MQRRLIGIVLALAASAGFAQDVEWQVVKPSNTGIPGEEARSVRLGPDGRLWVAARWPFWGEGGIGIYDPATGLWETWANWETPIPSEHVNDIEWADDGSVWIATSGGLVHKDGEDWTVYTTANAPLKHNGIRNISIAPSGVVWVNNSDVQQPDHALFAFDGESWEMHEVGGTLPWDEPWDELGSVLATSDGRVFATNTVLDGLGEYDGETWTLHVPAGGDRFRPLMEDASGDIWTYSGIGGRDLVYRFDRSSGTFDVFTPQEMGVVDTTPTMLSLDPQGRVYFGNWYGEVVRTADAGATWERFTDQQIRLTSMAFLGGHAYTTSPGAVRHLDENGVWLEAFNSYNTGMPWYFIEEIHAGADGALWIAAMETGVSRYTQGDEPFPRGAWLNLGSHNPNRDWPLLADGAAGVFTEEEFTWIASNGVGRWDGQQITVWDWQNSSFGVEDLVAFARDGNGDLWAGSDFTGIYRFTGGDWIRRDLGPALLDEEVVGMGTTGAGVMYVATRLALHEFDGQEWIVHEHTNSPINVDRQPLSMGVGPDGIVWVGTSDGMLRYDGADWTIFDQSNSPMPAEQVQGVDVRDDNLLAFSVHTFQSQTPFPSGVVVVPADAIGDGDAWDIYSHLNTPIPHWQLGDVEFDHRGRLWISAISEGVAVATFPGAGCPADMDGDGDADVSDFFAFLDLFAAGAPGADITGDGSIDVNDFFAYLDLFAAGC